MATTRNRRSPDSPKPGAPAKGAMPAGYTELEMGGANVDWRERERLEAQVIGTDSYNQEDGKVRRILIVQEGDDALRLWESAGLRRLFDSVRVGDHIIVAVTGTVDLQGGRHMRTFRAAIRRGTQRPAGPASSAGHGGGKGGGADGDIPF